MVSWPEHWTIEIQLLQSLVTATLRHWIFCKIILPESSKWKAFKMDAETGVHKAQHQEQKPRWARFREIIWDGEREPEERRLVQKLDIYLMSWATYGYFIRLLGSGNIINAYVSGMKEDLNFHGNQYNL